MKDSSTQPVLASENCWDSQNSSRNFTTKFQFVSKWIQTRQDTFCSAGDQVDSNTSRYDGEPQPGVQPCVQRVQRGRWRQHDQSRQNPEVSIDVAKRRVRSLEAGLAVLEEEGDRRSPEVRTLQRSLVQAKRAAQELPVGVQLTQAGSSVESATKRLAQHDEQRVVPATDLPKERPSWRDSEESAKLKAMVATMEDERDPATCQATVKRQATTSTRSAPRRDIPPILPTQVPAELDDWMRRCSDELLEALELRDGQGVPELTSRLLDVVEMSELMGVMIP